MVELPWRCGGPEPTRRGGSSENGRLSRATHTGGRAGRAQMRARRGEVYAAMTRERERTSSLIPCVLLVSLMGRERERNGRDDRDEHATSL